MSVLFFIYKFVPYFAYKSKGIDVKFKLKILLIVFSAFIISCGKSKIDNTDNKENAHENKETVSPGFQLLESNCFSCHSANPDAIPRIAPTMAAVKNAYLKENNQESFKKDLNAFLLNPGFETSKMHAAIKQYGLMPKMNFSDNQINDIADYLLNNKIESADWFSNQYSKEKANLLNSMKKMTPLEKGQSFAMQTKGILGKNLLNAINSKGTENALEFCSVKAYPLTDSMSNVLKAKIKRVSHRNRNPENAANEKELAYIKKAIESLSKSEKVKPELIDNGNSYTAYYPIMTDKMCLQCHGEPKSEILPKTLTKIRSIYPNDKASGFKVNELRGIWVIEMMK